MTDERGDDKMTAYTTLVESLDKVTGAKDPQVELDDKQESVLLAECYGLAVAEHAYPDKLVTITVQDDFGTVSVVTRNRVSR